MPKICVILQSETVKLNGNPCVCLLEGKLLFLTGTVNAQGFSVGGNFSTIQSPDLFSDFWKPGFGIVLHYPLIKGLGVSGSFTRHSLDWEKFAGGITGGVISGGTISIGNIGLFRKTVFGKQEAKLKIYNRLSISYFRMTASDIIAIEFGGQPETEALDGSRNDGVFSIGFGLDYQLNETVALFVEGSYYLAFKDPRIQGIPISLGLSIAP
jgi:hypothetical protein